MSPPPEDSSCSHKSTCALFPKFSAKAALMVWQKIYCDGTYSRCARYQLSLEGKEPPLNLLPNGKTLSV